MSCPCVQLEAQIAEVDHIREAIATAAPVDVLSHWQSLLHEQWKMRAQPACIPGLPPPFSRKRGCPHDSADLLEKAQGHREWRGVRTWRRKLLHYPADGKRPPFYGSFSRTRCASPCLHEHRSRLSCVLCFALVLPVRSTLACAHRGHCTVVLQQGGGAAAAVRARPGHGVRRAERRGVGGGARGRGARRRGGRGRGRRRRRDGGGRSGGGRLPRRRCAGCTLCARAQLPRHRCASEL